MTPAAPHVVIVGGGITGLSAAWRLQRSATGPLRITVFEASERWGGKLTTARLTADHATIGVDAGADSFVTRKPHVWDLVHELGIQSELIPGTSQAKGTCLLQQGRIVRVPLSPSAMATSSLMSPMGKLRLLSEPLVSARRDHEDESLAAFARRRLGMQAADNLVSPILAGIYNADPETQSILTTSPIMREMEREYGSIFVAALSRMRKARRRGAPRPRFVGFRGGARSLVEALVSSIDGDLLLREPVRSIAAEGSTYRVLTEGGTDVTADAVLLATPANAAARIIGDTAPEAAGVMASIQHSSIATLLLVLEDGNSRLDPQMTGLMIPRREGRLIDAIRWVTPEDVAGKLEVMKVFFGGAAPQLLEMSDAQITEAVIRQAGAILGTAITPRAISLHVWQNSYPEARVGHLALVDEIERRLPQGLVAAGASYRGLGVPDCIRQADDAATRILSYLEPPIRQRRTSHESHS